MNHSFRFGMGIAILVLAGVAVDRVSAQPSTGPAAVRPAAPVPANPFARPAAVAPATTGPGEAWIAPGSPFRKLAPGVMQEVIPDRNADETIERRGITVLSAGTGRKAIETIEITTDLAIVLMDIIMPETDGYETMQVIRQNASLRRLPIPTAADVSKSGGPFRGFDNGSWV